MKKHEVLLDMINDSITFSSGYCMHLEVLSSSITLKQEGIQTTLKVNHKDLTPKRILQKSTDENLDDFLSRNIKLS